MNPLRMVRLLSHMVVYQFTTENPRNYKGQWNSYWGSVQSTGPDGEVLWDNVPERAAEEDLERFLPHMNPNLPILDLGCGNGRQSRFLAGHFRKVIGVDVAPAAITRAEEESDCESNVEYRVFDGINPAEAEALHDEFGDMNIYMRGVLHVIHPRDQANFVASLRTLLGESGTLYQIELTDQAFSYFLQFPGDSPSGLPRLLHQVIRHGIKPGGFRAKDVDLHFPSNDWLVLEEGHGAIHTLPFADGRDGHVPAYYVITRAKQPVLEVVQ